MKFRNVTYYDDSGNRAVVGSADDPLQPGGSKTQISKLFVNLQQKNLRWEMETNDGIYKPIVFTQGKVYAAVVSSDQRFLVVTFSGNPNWSGMWDRAAVFNADGSLRGKFTPPVGLTPKPAEGIFGVDSHNGIIEISVYYNYDSIAVIEFDPERMQWGKVVRLGGRA